ncbi:MAG TPA: SDR family NAD(P)-dependent oxidoreductase [Steroidobacteraceae bacterium]|nr:SDR family NAD(P)-dependent oxidoreductase [Steroidobacteraceae bacterium]
MAQNSGPVAMITGAAGNLGAATAQAFAAHGARLVLLGRTLESLRAAYPGESADRMLLAADLSDEDAVRRGVETALARFGGIQILCNIAGGFHYGEPVHKMPREVWNRFNELNAGTLLSAVKAVVPHMIEAADGVVFNIGSAASVHGHARMAAYAASKGEVLRFTESMAEELAGTGVSVFCIMPTVIDTPENRADMPKANPASWTPPAEIAELMWLLTAKEAGLMSGCLIPLEGRVRR